MWFSNVLLYRLTNPLEVTPEALEEALKTKVARPCESQELTTFGFCAPLGKGPDAPLVHVANGFMLISAGREERILPGSVVRDAVKEKVEEIEAAQLRKVYKKERDQIKDEIIQAFLPRAFLRKSTVFAALDLESNYVYVNSASYKRAEDILSLLREVLGSLPVRPVRTKIAPTATLTEWVKNQKTDCDFSYLADASLVDTGKDGGKILVKNQDLTCEQIANYIASGKVVSSLAIAYKTSASFVIAEDMAIRRLRFDDLLQTQASEDGGDDAEGQFSASFVLMMMTLREMVPLLLTAFGGEDIPAGI